MGDDKKRKSKLITSYSNMMSNAQAEERLGFRFGSLKALPVDPMLANANKAKLDKGERQGTMKTKRKVYRELVRYLLVEGYPTEADPDFKEANINHLVYATISPILEKFILTTGRKTLRLRSDKEIVSTDGETGATEEFVVSDLISVKEEKFILVVEANRSSLGQAMKQCLLSMKDMSDNNCGGEVYGFVTTGKSWQMLRYDGASFHMTDEMVVLFHTMDEDKARWMRDCSILVDCMNIALRNGGT
jgi:hypothetical protein